jgi:hypothetical protein
MKCVCFKCSKLLVSKEKYKQAEIEMKIAKTLEERQKLIDDRKKAAEEKSSTLLGELMTALAPLFKIRNGIVRLNSLIIKLG